MWATPRLLPQVKLIIKTISPLLEKTNGTTSYLLYLSKNFFIDQEFLLGLTQENILADWNSFKKTILLETRSDVRQDSSIQNIPDGFGPSFYEKFLLASVIRVVLEEKATDDAFLRQFQTHYNEYETLIQMILYMKNKKFENTLILSDAILNNPDYKNAFFTVSRSSYLKTTNPLRLSPRAFIGFETIKEYWEKKLSKELVISDKRFDEHHTSNEKIDYIPLDIASVLNDIADYIPPKAFIDQYLTYLFENRQSLGRSLSNKYLSRNFTTVAKKVIRQLSTMSGYNYLLLFQRWVIAMCLSMWYPVLGTTHNITANELLEFAGSLLEDKKVIFPGVDLKKKSRDVYGRCDLCDFCIESGYSHLPYLDYLHDQQVMRSDGTTKHKLTYPKVCSYLTCGYKPESHDSIWTRHKDHEQYVGNSGVAPHKLNLVSKLDKMKTYATTMYDYMGCCKKCNRCMSVASLQKMSPATHENQYRHKWLSYENRSLSHELRAIDELNDNIIPKYDHTQYKCCQICKKCGYRLTHQHTTDSIEFVDNNPCLSCSSADSKLSCDQCVCCTQSNCGFCVGRDDVAAVDILHRNERDHEFETSDRDVKKAIERRIRNSSTNMSSGIGLQ